MANYFRVTDKIEIVPGTKVIKSTDIDSFSEADQLMQATELRRKKILAEAHKNYRAQQQRGFNEGAERAKQDKLNAINAANKRLAEYSTEFEKSVGDIVQSILLKVLGSFDKGELLLNLVGGTIKEYNRTNKIKVMVKPDHVEYLEKHIEDMIKEHPVIDFIEIVPDHSVEEGDCIVDTQTEMIFVSLEQQLAAIRETMNIVSDHE